MRKYLMPVFVLTLIISAGFALPNTDEKVIQDNPLPTEGPRVLRIYRSPDNIHGVIETIPTRTPTPTPEPTVSEEETIQTASALVPEVVATVVVEPTAPSPPAGGFGGPTEIPPPTQEPQLGQVTVVNTVSNVYLAYYDCDTQGYCPDGPGGRSMKNGEDVHPGAAACDWSYLPKGTHFRIVGIDTIFTCKDTGNAVIGWTIDIWEMYARDGQKLLSQVGTNVTIEIVTITESSS